MVIFSKQIGTDDTFTATKTPHTELMLPPRITRSQALNQSPHPQDKDDDEPDPLSDLEGPAIPGSSTRHR